MAGFVEAGGEGVAFYPGLRDPAQVTKLFFSKKAYDRTVAATNLARKQLTNVAKNQGTLIEPLPGVRNSNIEARANVAAKYYNDERTRGMPIFAAQMPHLGMDIYTAIYDHEAIVKGIAIRPLLDQFIKLFTQISQFNEKGFFHADISIMNVTIKMDPLELFIIDYGKFNTLAHTLENAAFGYAIYPPEYLLKEFVGSDEYFKYVTDFLLAEKKEYKEQKERYPAPLDFKKPKTLKDTLHKNICIYATEHAGEIYRKEGSEIYDDIITMFKQFIRNREVLEARINSLYTLDSFPLAIALSFLLNKVETTNREDSRTYDRMRKILEDLSHLDVLRRIDATEALARLCPLTAPAKGGAPRHYATQGSTIHEAPKNTMNRSFLEEHKPPLLGYLCYSCN